MIIAFWLFIAFFVLLLLCTGNNNGYSRSYPKYNPDDDWEIKKSLGESVFDGFSILIGLAVAFLCISYWLGYIPKH